MCYLRILNSSLAIKGSGSSPSDHPNHRISIQQNKHGTARK
jgi:hypothetical protein